MPDTLSINLVPGYLPSDDELITPAILRLLARPTITLVGTLGAASIADGAVTTAKLADGALSADTTGRNKMADQYVTAAKLNATQDWSGKTLSGNPAVTWTGAIDFSAATFTPPPGSVVTFAHASTNATTTISASIPKDSSTPLFDEGTKLAALDCSITPKFATSKLLVRVSINYLPNSARAIVALFRDPGTSDPAIFADGAGAETDYNSRIDFEWVVTAGSTSLTTFKVNIGKYSTDGGDVRLNQIIGGSTLGGIIYSTISVMEITAT